MYKRQFIDTDGNYVIKLTDKVDYASFSDGYALIRKGNKWGFIDKKGNIVIKPAFYGAADFKEGFASIMEKVGDKYLSGYINKKGKMITKAIYEEVDDFQEGMACVKKNGKYGFINKKGKLVVNAIYDNAFSYENGLAYVAKGSNAYFIDKTGKKVITIK